MPRKATWLILIWTALMIWWAVGGTSNLAPCNGNQNCETGTAIGAGLAVTFIFFVWFVGFIVLSIAWFMTRPKNNVVVYGPSGQRVTLSEKEAQARVAKQPGWSYTPLRSG